MRRFLPPPARRHRAALRRRGAATAAAIAATAATAAAATATAAAAASAALRGLFLAHTPEHRRGDRVVDHLGQPPQVELARVGLAAGAERAPAEPAEGLGSGHEG